MSFAILIVAEKELLERIRSPRTVILFAITAITLGLAFVGGAADFVRRVSDHRDALRTTDASFVVREPGALSVICTGLDEAMGRRFVVDSVLGTVEVDGRPLAGGRLFEVMPPLDVEIATRILLSLVAGLLVFDAISGERESGRLALLLTNRVSRAQILLGKWVGGHVLILALLIPTLLAGMLWISLGAGIRLSGAEWQRVGAFFLLAVVYLSFFVTLGLMISTLTRRPATTSIIVLFVWAFLVFLAPSLLSQAARAQVDLPEAQRLDAARTQAWIEAVFTRIERQRQGEPAPDGHVVPSGSVDHDYFARAAQRVNLARSWSVLSPAAAMSFGASAVAGTGPDDEVQLKREVLEYRTAVLDAPDEDPVGPRVVSARIPVSSWWSAWLRALLAIAGANLACLAVAVIAFDRYDPR